MPADNGNFSSQEMIDWVLEHGSDRLKKAHQAGMLTLCQGVYRSERLSLERPGWEYLPLENMTNAAIRRQFVDVHNPSEVALDAYLHAEEFYEKPNWPVFLKRWYEADSGEPMEIIVQRFLGRKAFITAQDYVTREGASS
jgi:hypothetical protein